MYHKKEGKELLNLSASISPTCNKCGALRINFSDNIFVEHLNNNGKEEGIRSCVKICQKCGHMEFFDENILKKFLPDMRRNPNKYIRMRGEGVLKSLFNPVKKFIDKVLFIRGILR